MTLGHDCVYVDSFEGFPSSVWNGTASMACDDETCEQPSPVSCRPWSSSMSLLHNIHDICCTLPCRLPCLRTTGILSAASQSKHGADISRFNRLQTKCCVFLSASPQTTRLSVPSGDARPEQRSRGPQGASHRSGGAYICFFAICNLFYYMFI